MKIKSQITQMEIFQGVMSETIDKMLQHGKISKFPKGTQLMRARENVEFIYIQLSGKSIEYKITYNGKRKILFIFGNSALLNGNVFNNKTSSIYCETIEQSEILVISIKDFTQLMGEDFTLTKNVLIAQEKKIWKLSRQLKNATSSISLEKRLVAKLWKLSKDFGIDTIEGREIDMSLSITFLADMLGTPRETVSRICSDLIESGLIKINKKRITIINPEEIKAYYKIEKKMNYK